MPDADMAVVAELADKPNLQADIMQEMSNEWEQIEAERNLRRNKNDQSKRARGTKSRAGKKIQFARLQALLRQIRADSRSSRSSRTRPDQSTAIRLKSVADFGKIVIP